MAASVADLPIESTQTILRRVQTAARAHRRRAQGGGTPCPAVPELISSWLSLLDTLMLHRCMRVCRSWAELARDPALHTAIFLPSEHAMMNGRQRAALTDEAVHRLIALAAGGLVSLRLHNMPALTCGGLVGLRGQPALHSVALTSCARITHEIVGLLPPSVRSLEVAGCKRITAHAFSTYLHGQPFEIDCFVCDECYEIGPSRDRVRCSAPACAWTEAGLRVCRNCKPATECAGCGTARCADCGPAYARCRCGQRFCADCEPASLRPCSDCSKAVCARCTVSRPCEPRREGEGCGAQVERCRRCASSGPQCAACGAVQAELPLDFEPYRKARARMPP